MIGNGMLDIRRLETLLAVARTGSFASAAESLLYTPSAVSQQMATLERATRVILFERRARGVELTPAGRALHEHAQAVIARLTEAEAEMDAIGGLADTRLRFGSFSSATGAFAGEAFRIFAERYPDADVCLTDGEPFEILAELSENILDLAVIFELDEWPVRVDYRGISASPERKVEFSPLFDDPYLLVLPSDHPLATEETITFEQLGNEPILVCHPWQRDFEKVCREAGFEPKLDPSCRGTGFEALQSLVLARRGLTLMPRLALGWLRDGLTARPLERAPVRRVQTAAPARAYRSSACVAMLEILVDLAEVRSSSGQPVGTTSKPSKQLV